MKKNAILRAAIGFPIGVTIGHLITIFISLGWADGYYAPCVPDLITAMGNEIGAVILQTLLCGLLGSGFAASSVIWEMENHDLVWQTGVYFFIVSLLMLPIAYFTYWMEHSLLGFLSYFGVFVLIFVIIWMIQFIIGKHNVRRLNEKLSNTESPH